MKFTGRDSLTLFQVPSGTVIEGYQEKARQLNKPIPKAGNTQLDHDPLRGTQQFDDGRGDPNNIPAVPQEGDFFQFPFRHISAAIVGSGSWKSTDFRNEKVLKESVPLLSNIKAYKNHELRVDKEIGYVGEATWQAARTVDGQKIAAGINAPFIIDRIIEPILVRKLMSPRPFIDSASVTVWFEWEASHDFENEYDFYYHIGEMIDDKEVTREVGNIVQYDESSLVSFGADPFAKKLSDKNGTPHLIDWGSVSSQSKFDKDPLTGLYKADSKFYIVNCDDDEKLLHLTRSSKISNSKESDNTNPMKEFLLQLAATFLGKKVEEITQADLDKLEIVDKEQFTKVKDNAAKLEGVQLTLTNTTEALTAVTKEKSTLAAEKVQLTNELKEFKDADPDELALNKEFAKIGKNHLESLREQAVAAYTASTKGEPKEIILNEIKENTSFDSLTAKIEEWGGKVAGNFSGTCKKCGSNEITFQSSASEEIVVDDNNENNGENYHLIDGFR